VTINFILACSFSNYSAFAAASEAVS